MNPAINEILADIPRKLENLQAAARRLDVVAVHDCAAELELAASAVRFLSKREAA
jgi:hypothetical protein